MCSSSVRAEDDEKSQPIASRATATLIKLTVVGHGIGRQVPEGLSSQKYIFSCELCVMGTVCGTPGPARSKGSLSQQLIGMQRRYTSICIVRLRDAVGARKKRRREEKKKWSVQHEGMKIAALPESVVQSIRIRSAPITSKLSQAASN